MKKNYEAMFYRELHPPDNERNEALYKRIVDDLPLQKVPPEIKVQPSFTFRRAATLLCSMVLVIGLILLNSRLNINDYDSLNKVNISEDYLQNQFGNNFIIEDYSKKNIVLYEKSKDPITINIDYINEKSNKIFISVVINPNYNAINNSNFDNLTQDIPENLGVEGKFSKKDAKLYAKFSFMSYNYYITLSDYDSEEEMTETLFEIIPQLTVTYQK